MSLLIVAIICIIVGGTVGFFVYSKDKKRAFPIKWIPAFCRSISVAILLFLVLAPQFPIQKNVVQKPVVLWLQDNSSSIKKALGNNYKSFENQANELIASLNKTKDVSTHIFGFGNRLMSDSIFSPIQTSTNIESAITDAYSVYKSQNIAAIILATDGVFNQGNSPTAALIKDGIPIYTIGLGDSTIPQDVAIGQFYANKTVVVNTTTDINADIVLDRLKGKQVLVELWDNNQKIQSKSVTAENDHQVIPIRFNNTFTHSGLHKLSIRTNPLPSEQNINNNKVTFFIDVKSNEAKILFWFDGVHPDMAAIKEALKDNKQFKFEINYGNQAPKNIDDYALIITHNEPQNVVPAGFDKKPVWFILGEGYRSAIINECQTIAQIVNSRPEHLPAVNKDFSLFTLLPETEQNLSKMPPLFASLGMSNVQPGAQILLKDKNTNSPLWIVNPAPNAKSILTGEGLWRWRLWEFKNFSNANVTDALIKQVVGTVLKKQNDQPFEAYMDKNDWAEGESIYLDANLYNESGSVINDPEASITIQKENGGNETKKTFDKTGNAYHIDLGVLPSGDYLYKATVNRDGKNYVSAGAFVVNPTNMEQMRNYSDFNVLIDLSKQTNGQFYTVNQLNDLKEKLLKSDRLQVKYQSETSTFSIINYKWIFGIVLLILTLEWIYRKYWS